MAAPAPPPDRYLERDPRPTRRPQSRRWSLAEAFANSAAGFGISVAVQAFIFPFFGIYISITTNIQLVLIFTAVSIARSYIMRRFFEWINR